MQPAKQPYLAVERLWVHEALRLHRPLPQDLRIGLQLRLLFWFDSVLHHRSGLLLLFALDPEGGGDRAG